MLNNFPFVDEGIRRKGMEGDQKGMLPLDNREHSRDLRAGGKDGV